MTQKKKITLSPSKFCVVCVFEIICTLFYLPENLYTQESSLNLRNFIVPTSASYFVVFIVSFRCIARSVCEATLVREAKVSSNLVKYFNFCLYTINYKFYFSNLY